MADIAEILARLDALEARNDRLEAENHALRGELTAMQAVGVPGSIESFPTLATAIATDALSRRRVLQRGLQVAAAAVAAAALAQRNAPSASATEDDVDYFDEVYASRLTAANEIGATAVYAQTDSSSLAAIFTKNLGTGPGLHAESASGNGAIEGKSTTGNGVGVWGNGKTGVFGISSHSDGVGVSGDGAVGVKGTSAKANYAAIAGEHTGTVGYGVLGVGKGAASGVLGRSPSGEGVRGEGQVGVIGTSSTTNFTAVVGEHTGTTGYGVLGVGKGSGVGVLGRNTAGDAVRGEGQTGVSGTSTSSNGTGVDGAGSGTNGIGVRGSGHTASGIGVQGSGAVGVRGSSSASGYEGVYGQHVGSYGYGVVGDGAGAGAGLLGRNSVGEGVRGEGKIGVYAVSTTTGGYGGVFGGGKAQLRLTPTGRSGKPTSGTHAIGELYLDKNGALFICTVAGTPGTWRKVSTAAA